MVIPNEVCPKCGGMLVVDAAWMLRCRECGYKCT